ncbi:MAG: AraC family transcriptional regulator [Xanthomonadales bacterium]|nr:AraC family transcriptional regulator [Xanthomonadales bacterium]
MENDRKSHLIQMCIKSYSRKTRAHSHGFFQLVLPLSDKIDIEINQQKYMVGIGDCIIIKPNEHHAFRADELARFVVADFTSLPKNIAFLEQCKFQITPSLLAFILFIEKQLESHVSQTVEDSIKILFFNLLEDIKLSTKLDHRIETVLSIINEDLKHDYTIDELANRAFLGKSQFKKLFKENLGETVFSYISKKRLEKARALLAHTDLPVNIIAEEVGYRSQSAFGRKFKDFYGASPRFFAKQKNKP